ncbi:NAD-dependent epimerase/dehydratase family protein [Pendulispora albinea]|uniref:NAD-dependent epimerase/dehydratase family protein n=1 Tax=Pendulispora albinea TaxID=2741071 RepID=A0ABZ2LL65_9BACT
MVLLFVCGGTGFIGTSLVRHAVARGMQVHVLVRSERSARKVIANGAVPVWGDLARPDSWRDIAGYARWIVHLAQPETFLGRVTRARAEVYREERLALDSHLLEAARGVERMIYVAGTSYYGDLGGSSERGLHDEDARPTPRGSGPYFAPAVDRVTDEISGGLRAIVAFPGYVYGDGSWFREYVTAPLEQGKPIHMVSGPPRYASVVHVDDCARALLHLLARGEVGQRYFVVDDEPLPWLAFYGRAAEAFERRLQVCRVPAALMRVLIGDVLTESLLVNAALSNGRLRATGFVPRYPSSREGLLEVARATRVGRQEASS